MKASFFIMLLLASVAAWSQTLDSTQQLAPVVVQAYASGRAIGEVAASVGVVDGASFQRFSNTSILPALNTVPGVRMEERSPGSFRFSIRGSLLRSPFGVRNVKVYWNGLPFTDAGGNTYLNLFDFASISTAEVIKGPGGSLYGAGTGGVLLLSSDVARKDQVEINATAGSYGLSRLGVSARFHRPNFSAQVQLFTQKYDGYRTQSATERRSAHADLKFLVSSNSTLSLHFLYTDLYYQTPGGLTLEQFMSNPRAARPAAGPNAGAVEQQASVTNKSPFLGLRYENDWTDLFSTSASIVLSHASFQNPTIRNFETRSEDNAGFRIENQFTFGRRNASKLTFGVEAQVLESDIDVNGNRFGVRDTLQTRDRLLSRTALAFAQVDYSLPKNFLLTVGASVNMMDVRFERFYPVNVNEQRTLEPSFSPRVALLNRITPAISVYTSVSRGFSPPGIAELYPSRQVFDRSIRDERGINVELGLRGAELRRTIDFDFTIYQFRLKDALVIRRDASIVGEPEYFVNAGETIQRGVEATISWHPIKARQSTISDLKIWNSFNYNHYRFVDYVQSTDDFSGNKLTGVPPTVNTAGLDIEWRKKVYCNITANFVDHIPLNDANTVFASAYSVIGARLGIRQSVRKHDVHIYGGVDNVTDEDYSLGNDLNAVGGRYYNVAPGRNYYVALQIKLNR